MLRLTVEISPGTRIREAAADMQSVSDRLRVVVEAKFNGIDIYAIPDQPPDSIVDRYDAAVENLGIFGSRGDRHGRR